MRASYDLIVVLNFLKQIKKHNNRTWFNDHKPLYDKAFEEMIGFADKVLTEVRKQDVIETPDGKKSLFRIYKDVRFSKDQSPYKINLGGGFRRATALRRGGYYFNIEPGNSFVAGGFWGPNPKDLNHIRQHIAADPDTLKSIVSSSQFKKTFGTLKGEQLKTAPRGFSNDDPAIEWLRYKQFLLRHDFKDEEVLSNNFHLTVAKHFQLMRPFLDYMSEILTTDLNGIQLPEAFHH